MSMALIFSLFLIVVTTCTSRHFSNFVIYKLPQNNTLILHYAQQLNFKVLVIWYIDIV